MAESTATVQRPKIIDAKSPVEEQVRAVSENVKDLYNFVNKINLSVRESERFLKNSSNISANRILEQLRNIDVANIHDHKMPDKGGVNGDHDRRYHTQRSLLNGTQSLTLDSLTVNKATVLNESGGDNDTRIEGDTDVNLLFVDASADRVAIGRSDPKAKLHIAGDAGSLPALASTTFLVVSNTSAAGDNTVVNILAGNAGSSIIYFGDTDSEFPGRIAYSHGSNMMDFWTNSVKALTIDSAQGVKAQNQFVLPSYTVATLPTGITGGLILVTDETGGSVPAFFEGTDWRRVQDRAIVS